MNDWRGKAEGNSKKVVASSNQNPDECIMDPIMASCQHIKFIEKRVETYHYSIDGERVVDDVEVSTASQVPPGHHYLYGAHIKPGINSMEVS